MGPLRHVLRVIALSTGLVMAVGTAAQAAPVVSGHIRGADRDTLLELAPGGATRTVVLGPAGGFALPAHKRWTLQLIASNGRYFGPVVVGHHGVRGWEALTGHTLRLGRIILHHGFAAPVHQRPVSSLETADWLHTSRAGAPLGAGRLGYIPRSHRSTNASVRVAHAENGSPPASGSPLTPGGDPDQDGIPTAFDADATGSGELNSENAEASSEGAGGGFFSQMNVRLENSLNDDASGVTTSQLSQSVQSDLVLAFGQGATQLAAGTSSVSVDCTALPWCSSATVMLGSGLTVGSAWNGTVPADSMQPGNFTVNVLPNAPISAIQPGGTFLINETGPNGTTSVPDTLDTYFITEPAISSVSVDGGTPSSLAYPASQSTLGTQNNPIMLGGDGILHLSFWRPQRAGLPGESSEFMDMGHLRYGLQIATTRGQSQCAASDYSDLSSTLVDSGEPAPNGIPLQDTATDAPPDPSNQLGFTVNLNQCLAGLGLPTIGQEIILPLTAAAAPGPDGSSDNASQMFYVCEVGCTPGVPSGLGGSPGPAPGPTSTPGVLSGPGVTDPTAVGAG
jgi:hypothetical protein